MIPFVAVVSLRDQQSRTFRLWIPLVLLWLLIVPLGVLLSPFIFLACLACRVNPFRGVALIWQIFVALHQAEFDFEHRTAGMSFHIL
jgi:Na+/H+ antiporter NhaC